MASTRDDPFASFNFLVEIDSVTKAGFSECSGLTMETDPIEYRNGNEPGTVRKIPGLPNKFSNITLKMGMTQNTDLWKWRKTVMDGRTERHSGSITLLNEERQPVVRWTFREGWPRKLDGPTFNAKNNEIAISTLEIVIEDLTMETV
jgi:phage tail-like protein